jgi:UDP-glucose 4-epimerase
MRILILGGNGFIGWHLTKLLSVNNKVIVFDKAKNSFFDEVKNVEYLYGNFNQINNYKLKILEVDIIFHLLSTTVPYTANLDPIEDVQTNLINTLVLLELLRNSKLKRFIFLSSGGTVYGNSINLPFDELHINKPIGSYGITKLCIEHYVTMYATLIGFKHLIIRPSNAYGPGQNFKNPQGVISTFLSKIIKNEVINIWGDGSEIRDYIYIDDLVQFIAISGLSNESGVYNIGSGIGHSLNEILLEIEKITNLKPVKNNLNHKLYNVKKVVLNIEKANKTFNFKTNTSLHDGISKHFKWINSIKLNQ